MDAHGDAWRNPKHRQQWANTLATYVEPVFGKVGIAEVGVTHVLAVLEPIWKTKTETATRIRARIERILDWAKARGLREGENPARWRGHLEHVLARPASIRSVRHHAAMPYSEVPSFLIDLRKSKSMGARALEFTILTAARTNETVGARWSEIDLQERIWLVPAERMKARRPHRVPLSTAALAVLKAVRLDRKDRDFVFPGLSGDRPISTETMSAVLDRMRRGYTVHGFRSAFRDWVAETTDFDGAAAEAALAHVIGDKVEAAYRRGDLFAKRAKMMEAWGEFCSSRIRRTPARRNIQSKDSKK